MTLKNYLVIVIGEDDNEVSSITNRVTVEFQPSDVAFAHAPIGSNSCVTINNLYDALNKSTSDFSIVVMASALDKTDIERAVLKFEEGHNTSQKPLLRKGFDSSDLEWRRQYDLAAAIVVAKRVDLFDALKAQMSQRQILAKPTEGGSK